jgi:hypothetical protein
MKSLVTLFAALFAVTAFAQAPAKKEEPKKDAAKPAATAPAAKDAKKAEPAKK